MEKLFDFIKTKPRRTAIALILVLVLLYELPTFLLYKFSHDPTNYQKFEERVVAQVLACTAIPSTTADLSFRTKSHTYVPKYNGSLKLECSFDTGTYSEEYQVGYKMGKLSLGRKDISDLANYFITGSVLSSANMTATLGQVKVAHVLFVFKQPESIDQAIAICRLNQNLQPQWIPVKTTDKIYSSYVLTGINCSNMFGNSESNDINIQNTALLKKYPDLNWEDCSKTATAKDYIAQFKDRISFLNENEKTLNCFTQKPLNVKERLNYMGKNGVKALGVMLSGKSEELLKIKSDAIKSAVIIYSDEDNQTNHMTRMKSPIE